MHWNWYFVGFPYVKKFYLIYDAFYAHHVRVHVRINDEVDEFCINQHIPIGFRLKRYTIKPNGLIGPIKDIPSSEWEVHWIKSSMFRNPMDALPRVPDSNAPSTSRCTGFFFLFVQFFNNFITKKKLIWRFLKQC